LMRIKEAQSADDLERFSESAEAGTKKSKFKLTLWKIVFMILILSTIGIIVWPIVLAVTDGFSYIGQTYIESKCIVNARYVKEVNCKSQYCGKGCSRDTRKDP